MVWSNWLSELGSREEALAAIEEAVTTDCQLATARPDVFLPLAATSLSLRGGLTFAARRHRRPHERLRRCLRPP